MALIEITAPREGVYQWQTPFRLDGVSGTLKWAWNTAILGWTLWLYDGTNTLVTGPIVISNSPADLFASWHAYPIPPGRIYCESESRIPGRDDFLSTARLVYETVG